MSFYERRGMGKNGLVTYVWTDIEIENMDFWLLNPLMAPTELFWSIAQILPTSWIIDLPDLQSHCAQSCCQVCSFCSHAKNLYVLLRKCTTYEWQLFSTLTVSTFSQNTIYTCLGPKAVMQIQKSDLPNSSNIGKFGLMPWFQDSEKLFDVQDQSYFVSISSSKRKLVTKTVLTGKTVMVLI